MNPQEDQEPPLLPPTVDRVVRRAFCLSAVVCRSFIDDHPTRENFQRMNRGFLTWLKEIGAHSELESWELAALSLPLGELDPQTQLNGAWACEGLAALAWAVGLLELPAHDACVVPVDVTSLFALLDPAAAQLPVRLSLRPAGEIEAGAAKAFALHWRLRNFSLNHEPMDFAEFARTAWFGPLNIEGVALAESDLSIGGVPIFRAEADALQRAMSIAMERHKAFNWLRGCDEIYSETDTST
jgi:hypothetical protein